LLLNAGARMTTYIIITTFATQLGVVSAAVNKMLLDLYILLGLCAEPVFTVGNILLPRKVQRNYGEALMNRRALFYISVIMGASLSCVAYVVCGSPLFATDPQLRLPIEQMKPWVAATIGLATAAYANDGCVIGLHGAHFVGVAQIVNTSVFIVIYLGLRHVLGPSTSLVHLWTALLVFQASRIIEHMVKIIVDERAFAAAAAPRLPSPSV